MHAAGTQHIEKLCDNNYEVWRMQMKSVLVYNDLWGYVSGTIVKPEDADAAAAWIVKDEKALALIVLGVSKTEIGHIRNQTTSKGAWNELEKIHKSQGPVRKAVLYRQLYQTKKMPDQSMAQFVNEFQQRADMLADVGVVVPQELLSIMLLSNLPDEFENFCVAIESRDDIPEVGVIKAKLIEEDARRGSNNDGKSTALYSRISNAKRRGNNMKNSGTNSDKFSGKCFRCGKVGHRATDCRTKLSQNKAKYADTAVKSECEAEDTMIATALACKVKEEEWCMDSGATMHMCKNKRLFEKISNDSSCSIRTAGKSVVKACGSGRVNLDVQVQGTTKRIILKDGLYVPDLRNNLISVSAIAGHGYSVTFGKENAVVSRADKSTVLIATRKNRMYVVNTVPRHNAMVADGSIEKLKMWHERYGHLNFSDLHKLKKNNMVTGLDIPSKKTDIPCEICNRAKIHALPHRVSETKTKDTLGLIHTDICGPMNVASLGGARYFVTFIDDKTRYIEVAMLKKRGDVFAAFKNYLARVEREHSRKIKKIRSDNAKEYVSKEFNQFLEAEGIKREFSVEYTPQQNGVAERANRTLEEMARCLLLQSGGPTSLWAEAVNTAAFLRNRCPSRATGDKTPLELWCGNKPDVKILKTFGSHVTALKKGPGSSKWDAKGEVYMLVGYSKESKAYRLWRKGTTRIIKSYDVRIIEDPHFITRRPESVELPLLSQNMKVKEANEKLNADRDKMQRMDDDDTNNDTEDDTLGGEQRIEMDSNRIKEEGQPPVVNSRRGPGRPKLVHTGQRGRPKKEYQMANVAEVETDPLTIEEAVSSIHKNEWLEAMRSEYNSLKECGTWVLSDLPPGKRAISCKWVFHTKRCQTGEVNRYKARLVARGCEQRYGIDFDEVYAPVARMEVIRTLFALSVEEEMHIHQMDVVTAYVQGNLSSEIYMEQPTMFEETPEDRNKVCKLLRPLYGLKQSGREWHQKLRTCLNNVGLQHTENEPCVFVGQIHKEIVIVIVYVDDLLIASRSLEILNTVKSKLCEKFKMKDLGPVTEILGIRVQREGPTGSIRISQGAYVKRIIEKFNMNYAKPASTPMEAGMKLSRDEEATSKQENEEMKGVPYRELVGSLTYLANTTRPDLAFVANTLSRFNANPVRLHWKAAKHSLSYLIGTTDLEITYNKTRKPLHAHVDADWGGNIDNRRSCTGFVLMLAEGPISWKSKQQKSVALSTMEAEYMALSEVVKEVIYTRRLLTHMGGGDYANDPTCITCDNQSAIRFSKESVYHQRSKHVDIRFHFTREAQEAKEVIMQYIPTEENPADMLTKPLLKNKTLKCRNILRLSNE